MANFYFLVGISGSGKSTWASKKAEESNALIVCPDDIRERHRVRSDKAFIIAREQIGKGLKSGKDVIFDATNTIRKWRQDNILSGKKWADKVICVVFDLPLDLCVLRNKARGEKGGRYVPENVIRRMYDQLKNNWPEFSEGFDEIIEIKN